MSMPRNPKSGRFESNLTDSDRVYIKTVALKTGMTYSEFTREMMRHYGVSPATATKWYYDIKAQAK